MGGEDNQEAMCNSGGEGGIMDMHFNRAAAAAAAVHSSTIQDSCGAFIADTVTVISSKLRLHCACPFGDVACAV
jgi:hypothetical protein